MINRIPVSLLSKTGTYEIEIHGAKVMVYVVETPAMIDAKIEELKSSFRTLQSRVVGLDIKYCSSSGSSPIAKILLLSVGTCCLVIHLDYFGSYFPITLVQFLSDETICFLGTGMRSIVQKLNAYSFYQRGKGTTCVKCSTGVEVGYLAAKILKKANIEKYGLEELAGLVGIDIKEPIGKCPDYVAKVFTDEEIKYAMHNSYTSFVIGKKLLGMH
uniref:3'-5' exonuclease domain-containing protein n=1 Tax=Fagus sylvatica TaxID=28930 RepID=A0A2N9G345_FAGSY